MKRGLIATIAMTAAIIAMTATSFAKVQTTKISGSIKAADSQMAISLPSNVFTIKPNDVTGSQITSYTNYIQNPLSASDSNSICYDVKIIGYTSAVNSDDSENPIKLSNEKIDVSEYAADDTSKTVYIALQAADSVASKGTESVDFADAKLKTNAVVSVLGRGTLLDSETDFVTVKPGQFVPYRVTGTVNPNATWAAADSVSVTPIFKISPNFTEAIK